MLHPQPAYMIAIKCIYIFADELMMGKHGAPVGVVTVTPRRNKRRTHGYSIFSQSINKQRESNREEFSGRGEINQSRLELFITQRDGLL